jgi:hypothetical protein
VLRPWRLRREWQATFSAVRGTIDGASHPDLLLVPFSKRYTPVSMDYVPKLPAQRAATYEPWSLYDILVPAAVNAIEAWTTTEMSNLQAMRNLGAAVQDWFGTCLLRHKPLVVGQSQFQPRARGIVWDCRPWEGGLPAVPVDYGAPPSSSLNVDWVDAHSAN